VHDTQSSPSASTMIYGPCSMVISSRTLPFDGSTRVIVPSR
jgi:hypothetical protein